jgi:hypothetical protein
VAVHRRFAVRGGILAEEGQMGRKRMRTKLARICFWMGAGLVSVALVAAPAYAARGKSQAHQKAEPHTANSHAFKDTGPGSWGPNGHTPAETSFPQGYSPSDPDGATNGGADKPGEVGGFNDDKDGNNGCGNDSDREDDNNGWCGKKPTPTVAPSVAPTESETPTGGTPSGEVLGKIVQSAPEVLGVQLSRTGAPVFVVFGTGLLMLFVGLAIRRSGPRHTARETR